MKIVIGFFATVYVLLCACSNSKVSGYVPNNDSLYSIKAIDSINNWYTVYAKRNDSVYKIVVKKEKGQDFNCKNALRIGHSYKLELHSTVTAPIEINGVKLERVNTLDVNCYTYDEKTTICIEPKKGIYDLYHTNNIKGLCFIE